MLSGEKSEPLPTIEPWQPCVIDGVSNKKYTLQQARWQALAPNVKIEPCANCGMWHLKTV